MGNREFMYGGISDVRLVDGCEKEDTSSMVSSGRKSVCALRSNDWTKRRNVGNRTWRRCGCRLSSVIGSNSTRNWIWRQLDDIKFGCFPWCVEIVCFTYECIYKCISGLWNRNVEEEIEKKESNPFCPFFDTGISGGMSLVRKECCASTIVEMAYLMPVVLLTWMLVIFALFYYHDKTLAIGAAYETVAVSSEWYKESDEVDIETVSKYFQNRIRGKLLFFSYMSADVQLESNWLTLDVSARRRGMRMNVVQKVEIRNPEKEIRRIQIIKDGLEDLVD